MGNYKIIKVVSASLNVDNSDDANRSYRISANVDVDENSIRSITNGIVKAPDSEAQLADFNDQGHLSSNIYNTGDEVDRTAVFSAISDFCNGVRADRPVLPGVDE